MAINLVDILEVTFLFQSSFCRGFEPIHCPDSRNLQAKEDFWLECVMKFIRDEEHSYCLTNAGLSSCFCLFVFHAEI